MHFYTIVVLSLGALSIKTSSCFTPVLSHIRRDFAHRPETSVNAKKKTSTKKKGTSSSGVGVKGFGRTSSPSSTISSNIDRSKQTLSFYSYIENNKIASENLKRVALASFPINDELSIRGVVALKPIKKGDVILNIPYEMALNLGREGGDPTLPAVEILKIICERDADISAYLDMLPEFGGRDCMGSTDFFSSEALDELQHPLVNEETLKRREKVMNRFDEMVVDEWRFQGETISCAHLQWAVWLVTSRVLTVQGSGGSFRLMIPFIDMCNHDRQSPHILTGRAVPGGFLKVVAGANIEAGEQINICYGGGVAGNDRFIQDYGFLDTNEKGYDLVAKMLLSEGRDERGAKLRDEDKSRVIEALEETTMSDDIDLLLKNGNELRLDTRLALEFRIGLKKALARFQSISKK